MTTTPTSDSFDAHSRAADLAARLGGDPMTLADRLEALMRSMEASLRDVIEAEERASGDTERAESFSCR